MRDWRYREEDVAPSLGDDRWGLACGCFLRALGWSAAAGGVIGTSYVVLMAVFRLLEGRPNIGVSIGPLIFAGASQGIAAGVVIGVTTGGVLALVGQARGLLSRRPSWSRALFGAIGAATSVICVMSGQRMTGLPYPLLAARSADIILGLALVGLGGLWAGDRVARWYVSEAVEVG